MASDPNRPILTFDRPAAGRRTLGGRLLIPFPPPANSGGRERRVGPRFEALRVAAAQGIDPLTLRDDPSALAPETILVFELTGSHVTFANALASVNGLEIVGEEDGIFEDAGEQELGGFLYLGVPTQAALEELLRLWTRYRSGREIDGAQRGWVAVFEHLHDLRRWGPQDRLTTYDRLVLEELAADQEFVNVEIELAYLSTAALREAARTSVARDVTRLGGSIIRFGSVPEVAYDAVLCRVPAASIATLVAVDAGGLKYNAEVFSIRPQATFAAIDLEQADGTARDAPLPEGDPILAILDGVPVAGHPLLAGRVVVEDPDDLARIAVGRRRHGTAMSSLAIWGDLSSNQPSLSRPVVVRPLIYAPAEIDGFQREERFPDNSLIPDDLVRAIRGLVDQNSPGGASAPTLLIINLSLGDRFRPFSNRLSAWARALDWLSYRYGVLFIVSAGNAPELSIPGVRDADEFRSLAGDQRSKATLAGLRESILHRTILAPAEAVNALTVGARHVDQRGAPPDISLNNHDPFPGGDLPSPISRVGPGFLRSVKPEVLAPGGRLRAFSNIVATPLSLAFNDATRYGGLKVASFDGVGTAWSGATSAAAALTSRLAHQIYEALENAYGAEFQRLSKQQKALILKGLIVHRASVPAASRTMVTDVFGPTGTYLSEQRKRNVQRLFGFGFLTEDESMFCDANRATIWGVGELATDEALDFRLPVPPSLVGNRVPRSISTTLVWFSPISPGRRAYKAVRLQVEEPSEIGGLGVDVQSGQAGRRTAERGTVFQRCWSGGRKPRSPYKGNVLDLRVSRKPDSDDDAPDRVAFAIIATVEAEGNLPIYDEVRSRLAVRPRVAARVRTR